MGIKIKKIEGYNDGYYWDYRVWFEYEGRDYTYIDVGSGSGYISCYEAIRYGSLDLPEGYRDDIYMLFRPNVSEDVLRHAVEMLLSSGEDEIELNDIPYY